MQLTKLLTLSQFIDSIVDNGYNDSYNINKIIKYNNFLKQPLKKEMFVGDEAGQTHEKNKKSKYSVGLLTCCQLNY